MRMTFIFIVLRVFLVESYDVSSLFLHIVVFIYYSNPTWTWQHREREREQQKIRKKKSFLSASVCVRSLQVKRRWTTIATILRLILLCCLLCRSESRIRKKIYFNMILLSLNLITLVCKLLWTFSVFLFHKHDDYEKFRQSNNVDRKRSKCCRSFTNALTKYSIFYS